VRRLLKTDLFDEAVSAGLYPTLAARADCVLGVDVSPAAVAAACRRHPALCGATADVRRLPFGDGSVDAVVSISTLDHFTTRADIVAGVAELHRVLRPGGTLVLTLDNLANPVVALRNALPYHLVHRAGLVPYFVGRSLRPAPLRRLLARQGFDVTECSATVHAPRLVAVALARLLDRSGGPRLRAAFAAALLHCERAARWPTRLVTGHFVAVRCVRRTGGTPPALDDGTGRPPVSPA
jgi:SAM-dependent methyltransferase